MFYKSLRKSFLTRKKIFLPEKLTREAIFSLVFYFVAIFLSFCYLKMDNMCLLTNVGNDPLLQVHYKKLLTAGY